MPSIPDAEVWFDEYVRGHGHDPGQPEPDLGVVKNPDRLITWNGNQLVCEIKQFTSSPFSRLLGTARVGALNVSEVLNPVRRKVGRAAEQLKPLAGSGWPLVIVLADPIGVGVPLSTQEIIWALYGDPVIRLTIPEEGVDGSHPPEHSVGRNSRLLRNHQYVSAVVALRRGSHRRDWQTACWERLKVAQPNLDLTDFNAIARLGDAVDQAEAAALANNEIEEGHYLCADVFTATSETAVALPRNVFDGPRDTRWDYIAETEQYTRTRGNG